MQIPANVKIHPSWYAVLQPEFSKPYMAELRDFLQQEKQAGKTIFPPGGQIFNAFNSTPFDQVKVVILGQDPYHGAGQAHGLCFSVMPGVRIPPSLQNIYKELATDLGIEPPQHGCLQPWAEQGVLLLNATLTVEESRAGAHQGRGWEQFTDAAVHALAEQRDGLVFILWGSHAQKKGGFIDRNRHLVLSAPHPSPLSAHRGFFGTRPFSQANQWLQEHGMAPVNWALPAASALRRVSVEI
ncbi:uracil-DNA glycosylase [Microbulbifer sp. SA54]|uniref:uracil-DNA glycosylase n=1 Tax=Microbulbifer sp. SA54 TaxID=3401577 RepID=UPI003AAB0708